MSGKPSLTAITLICAFAISCATKQPSQTQDSKRSDLIARHVRGAVSISTNNGKSWHKLAAGMRFKDDTTIRTLAGGSADLEFTASRSLLRILPASTVAFNREIISEDRIETQIDLKRGRILMATGRTSPGSLCNIKTRDGVAGVLGASKFDANENGEFRCLAGTLVIVHVAITSHLCGTAIIQPGQSAKPPEGHGCTRIDNLNSAELEALNLELSELLASEAEPQGTRVLRVAGLAMISKNGGKSWQNITKDMVLKSGWQIQTSTNALVDIELKDHFRIRIIEKSDITFDKTTTDANGVTETQLDVRKGRALITVGTMPAESKFELKTFAGVIGIRGETEVDAGHQGIYRCLKGTVVVAYVALIGDCSIQTIPAGHSAQPNNTGDCGGIIQPLDKPASDQLTAEFENLKRQD